MHFEGWQLNRLTTEANGVDGAKFEHQRHYIAYKTLMKFQYNLCIIGPTQRR